jgi:hypothetical protein
VLSIIAVTRLLPEHKRGTGIGVVSAATRLGTAAGPGAAYSDTFLAEFGAVKVVSGNVVGSTQTATLVVEQRYQDFEQSTAYAIAFLLAFAAILCLIVVSLIRPQHGAAWASSTTGGWPCGGRGVIDGPLTLNQRPVKSM